MEVTFVGFNYQHSILMEEFTPTCKQTLPLSGTKTLQECKELTEQWMFGYTIHCCRNMIYNYASLVTVNPELYSSTRTKVILP